MRRFIERIRSLYYRIVYPLDKQAQIAGVTIGKGNFVDSKFWSSEPYLIAIGNNCQITSGVKMFTHGGGQILRDKYPDFDIFGKINIGDYVYIGANAIIMPGVTIEDHVLVASGSVVTKSLRARGVYGGNPAKYICSIDEYEKNNIKYNTSSKHLSGKDKKQLLLSLPSKQFVSKPFIGND